MRHGPKRGTGIQPIADKYVGYASLILLANSSLVAVAIGYAVRRSDSPEVALDPSPSRGCSDCLWSESIWTTARGIDLSLRPQEISPVPEETCRVAKAAFRKGRISLRMRDEIGPLLDDPMCAPLVPSVGQPAEGPWRLALVTVPQFGEGWSDRQAADAVGGRIDGKDALGLEWGDPGCDASVLWEFC